jgi:protein transport protein SEC13
MEVHKDIIHSIETDISQKRVVTACSDGMVRVFSRKSTEDALDMAMDSELVADAGPATKAVFINTGEFIASSYFTGKLLLWKLEGSTYTKKYEKQLPNGSINSISSVFRGTSFDIYCACSDGNVGILTVSSSPSFNVVEDRVFCHRFGVSAVSGYDGGFVTGGMDYSVAIWENGEEVARFRDHKGFVRDVAVSPQGCFKLFCMATCSEDGTVMIYTKKGDRYESQRITVGEPCYTLAWSASGFTLSVGYGESKFKCYVPDGSGEFTEVTLTKVGK